MQCLPPDIHRSARLPCTMYAAPSPHLCPRPAFVLTTCSCCDLGPVPCFNPRCFRHRPARQSRACLTRPHEGRHRLGRCGPLSDRLDGSGRVRSRPAAQKKSRCRSTLLPGPSGFLRLRQCSALTWWRPCAGSLRVWQRIVTTPERSDGPTAWCAHSQRGCRSRPRRRKSSRICRSRAARCNLALRPPCALPAPCALGPGPRIPPVLFAPSRGRSP